MADFCVCKHHWHDHIFKPDWNRYQCEKCMYDTFVSGYFVHDSFPSFHSFAANNLIFLENKIKDKILYNE